MDGGTGCKNRNGKFCRRKNIGIISGFLRNQGSSDKVQALIDAIPPLKQLSLLQAAAWIARGRWVAT
jgi:hypothetical protein